MCGHCEAGDICDKPTGHCTQCEIGWELPNCTGRHSVHTGVCVDIYVIKLHDIVYSEVGLFVLGFLFGF